MLSNSKNTTPCAGPGLDAWQQNSRIVHAVADSPHGAYVFKQQVFGVFSHNPTVVSIAAQSLALPLH